jgi:hypothetical protein
MEQIAVAVEILDPAPLHVHILHFVTRGERMLDRCASVYVTELRTNVGLSATRLVVFVFQNPIQLAVHRKRDTLAQLIDVDHHSSQKDGLYADEAEAACVLESGRLPIVHPTRSPIVDYTLPALGVNLCHLAPPANVS